MFAQYKKFLFRGNLLDLVVAFILGGAFNGVVMSLASDVIMAPIAHRLHFDDLRSWEVGGAFVGIFLSNLVGFIIVATLLYTLVRMAGSMTHIPREETRLPESDEVALLREILQELRAADRAGTADRRG